MGFKKSTMMTPPNSGMALTCDLQKASRASFLLPGWTSRELTAGVMRAYSMTADTSSMSASCSPMLSTRPSSVSCSIAFQAACTHLHL